MSDMTKIKELLSDLKKINEELRHNKNYSINDIIENGNQLIHSSGYEIEETDDKENSRLKKVAKHACSIG